MGKPVIAPGKVNTVLPPRRFRPCQQRRFERNFSTTLKKAEVVHYDAPKTITTKAGKKNLPGFGLAEFPVGTKDKKIYRFASFEKFAPGETLHFTAMRLRLPSTREIEEAFDRFFDPPKAQMEIKDPMKIQRRGNSRSAAAKRSSTSSRSSAPSDKKKEKKEKKERKEHKSKKEKKERKEKKEKKQKSESEGQSSSGS